MVINYNNIIIVSIICIFLCGMSFWAGYESNKCTDDAVSTTSKSSFDVKVHVATDSILNHIADSLSAKHRQQ